MKKKQKCYIYTRVSTAIQVDGYSLDAQRDKLTKYAEYQDMEVVKEFSDAGHSGKNINGRPEFSRMLEEIASDTDGVSYVLFFVLFTHPLFVPPSSTSCFFGLPFLFALS